MAAGTNVPEEGPTETQVQNLDATLVRQQILQLSPLPEAPPPYMQVSTPSSICFNIIRLRRILGECTGSKRGMGRGVRVKGGTAERGSARDRGRGRPGRGRAPTNARGAGMAVGLRSARRRHARAVARTVAEKSSWQRLLHSVWGEIHWSSDRGLDSVWPMQGMGSWELHQLREWHFWVRQLQLG